MKRSRLVLWLVAITLLAGLGLVFLVDTASAQTIDMDFLPALYFEDYGAGSFPVINNYTIISSGNSAGATWQLLGTNNQKEFDLLDSRKDKPFSAGVYQQFNISNSAGYRWYYLHVVSGFGVPSTLDIQLDNTVSSFTPKEEFTPYFNMTMGRSPFVIIFDFSKNGVEYFRNYTITSDNTFGAIQTWYLFGSNSTTILGNNNPALVTLLDTQTSIGFTGGITQIFDITGQQPFTHYIIYVKEGFPTLGTLLEFRWHAEPFEFPPGQVIAVYRANGDIPLDPIPLILGLVAFVVIYTTRRKKSIQCMQ